MAHCAKYGKAACGQMLSHYDRGKENFGNENIDRTKTHLNYNLASHQQMKQGDFIKKRCGEVRMQNRKDVNVMCSWVVTVPKDLSKHEHELFFKESYKFLENRYGKENVISAWVHNDEITPHLHFAFVPVVKDKKRDGYKVSAKEAVTRVDLQSFHNDLSTHLEQQLGHTVSVMNEVTRAGNLSIKELKRKTATERLEEIKDKGRSIVEQGQSLLTKATEQSNVIINKSNQEASRIVSEALQKANDIETSLAPLKAEYEALKAYIGECDKISEISNAMPDYVQVKGKGFLNKQEFVIVPKNKWLEKHIAANEKNYLKQATRKFEKAIADFRKTTSAEYIHQLEQSINQLKQNSNYLEREVERQRDDISKLRFQLREADERADDIIAKINKVLEELPNEASTSFVEKWNDSQQSRSHSQGWEMER